MVDTINKHNQSLDVEFGISQARESSKLEEFDIKRNQWGPKDAALRDTRTKADIKCVKLIKTEPYYFLQWQIIFDWNSLARVDVTKALISVSGLVGVLDSIPADFEQE